MELRHVETFLTIMKEGSFTRAAECLGYTQSSMTAHIHALEEALSVKLFERLSRQNTPTAAAQEFLPHARELLRSQENAVNAMLRFSGLMGSTVIIAASEALLMAEELMRFSENFPEVGLNIKVHSCPQVPVMVREGEADLGFFIWSQEPEDISPLKILASRVEPTYLVGRKGLFADLSSREICGRENYIAHVKGRLYAQMAETVFREWGISPRIIEAGSIPAVKELVMSGLGVSLLPASAVIRERAGETLDFRPWEDPGIGPAPRAMLVVHEQKILTPAMTEIAGRIERAFGGTDQGTRGK